MKKKREVIKGLFISLLIIVNGVSNLYSQEVSQHLLLQNSEEKDNLSLLEIISIGKPHKIVEDKERKNGFLNWLNSQVYAATIDKREEKIRLRKEWEKMLGVDIFFPYFKAKEVESWVREKAKIEFFNLKGEPKFKKNQIEYIFKIKF